MDKFDGIQRAEILSEVYASEVLLPLQFVAKPQKSGQDKRQGAQKTALPQKNKGRLISVCLRYGFCLCLLGLCLFGKLVSTGSLKTVSDFIKDELSKSSISEKHDG